MTSSITLTSSMRSNLSSLRNLALQMSSTQTRLSTGKKVNSAIDNASSFYQARALTNRASDLNLLLDAIGQGIQTITTADKSIQAGLSLIEQMKSVAQQAASIGTSSAEAPSLMRMAKGISASENYELNPLALDGYGSTQALLSAFGQTATAAYACSQFYAPGVDENDAIFGKGKWYLPAIGELMQAYGDFYPVFYKTGVEYAKADIVSTYTQYTVDYTKTDFDFSKIEVDYNKTDVTYNKLSENYYKKQWVYRKFEKESQEYVAIDEKEYSSLSGNYYILTITDKATGKETYEVINVDLYTKYIEEWGGTSYDDGKTAMSVMDGLSCNWEDVAITNKEYESLKDNYYILTTTDKATGDETYKVIGKEQYDIYVKEWNGDTSYDDGKTAMNVVNGLSHSFEYVEIDEKEYSSLNDNYYILTITDKEKGDEAYKVIDKASYEEYVKKWGGTSYDDGKTAMSVVDGLSSSLKEIAINEKEYSSLNDNYYILTTTDKTTGDETYKVIGKEEYDKYVKEWNGDTSYDDGKTVRMMTYGLSVNVKEVSITDEEYSSLAKDYYVLKTTDKTTGKEAYSVIDEKSYEGYIKEWGNTFYDDGKTVKSAFCGASLKFSDNTVTATADEYASLSGYWGMSVTDKATGEKTYQVISKDDYDKYVKEWNGDTSYDDGKIEMKVFASATINEDKVKITEDEYNKIKDDYYVRMTQEKNKPTVYTIINKSEYDQFVKDYGGTVWKDENIYEEVYSGISVEVNAETNKITAEEYDALKGSYYLLETYNYKDGNRSYSQITADEYKQFIAEYGGSWIGTGDGYEQVYSGVWLDYSDEQISAEEYADLEDNYYFRYTWDGETEEENLIKISKDEYEQFIESNGDTYYYDEENDFEEGVFNGVYSYIECENNNNYGIITSTFKELPGIIEKAKAENPKKSGDEDLENYIYISPLSGDMLSSSILDGEFVGLSGSYIFSADEGGYVRPFITLENQFTDNLIKPVVGDVMYADLSYSSVYDYSSERGLPVGVVTWVSDDGSSARLAGLANLTFREDGLFNPSLPHSEEVSRIDRFVVVDEGSDYSGWIEHEIGLTRGRVLVLEDNVDDDTDVASSSTNSSLNAYKEQFNSIYLEYDKLINDASYQGINLLTGGSLNIIFNETRAHSYNIGGYNALSSALGLTVADWSNVDDVQQSISQMQNAISTLRTIAEDLGNHLSIVETRMNFTDALSDVLQTGADDLVLADMNEESANYLALQTRQQLAVNALALASQASNSVLQLF